MEPLVNAVPGALVEIVRAAPLSQGKVSFAWRATVGPALDRSTAVRLEAATLIVDTASAQWSREIHRSTPLILRRLETLLGPGVVERLEVRTRSHA